MLTEFHCITNPSSRLKLELKKIKILIKKSDIRSFNITPIKNMIVTTTEYFVMHENCNYLWQFPKKK